MIKDVAYNCGSSERELIIENTLKPTSRTWDWQAVKSGGFFMLEYCEICVFETFKIAFSAIPRLSHKLLV